MRDNTQAKRGAGHYLLLVMSIAFAGEFYLFLTNALHEAGSRQPIAYRFLVLTLGVFLSAFVAFHGFARRIERPILLFLGLLLLQPAVDFAAKLVGRLPADPTTAVVTGVIGALLTWMALNAERQTAPSSAEMSQALRARALTASAGELGVEGVPGRIFVAVMDLAYPNAVVSLVCTSAGDASLYFNSGGGVIGGGEHEFVRSAAISFVREAESVAVEMATPAATDIPSAGNVIFYVRTPEALVASAAIAEAVLATGGSSHSPLYLAAQNVISQIRETAPAV